MKRRLALVAFIGLWSLLGATACAPATYLLFGEYSKEGGVVDTRGDFTLDSEVTIEAPTGDMNMTMSTKQRYANETTVLEAADGEPTKLRRVVETAVTDRETEFMGEREKESEKSPLHGETIVMTLVDGEWAAELEQGTPTKAQRDRLADLASQLGTSIYPDRELEVGEEWTVPQESLPPMLIPPDADDVQGNMTCTFTAIEEYEGVQCAVVDYELEVSFADSSTEGQQMSAKMTMAGKVHRSLDSHLDLLNEGSGTLTYTGTLTEGDQSMAFSGTGPVTFKETSEIVK
jgi:hypothetical protein